MHRGAPAQSPSVQVISCRVGAWPPRRRVTLPCGLDARYRLRALLLSIRSWLFSFLRGPLAVVQIGHTYASKICGSRVACKILQLSWCIHPDSMLCHSWRLGSWWTWCGGIVSKKYIIPLIQMISTDKVTDQYLSSILNSRFVRLVHTAIPVLFTVFPVRHPVSGPKMCSAAFTSSAISGQFLSRLLFTIVWYSL